MADDRTTIRVLRAQVGDVESLDRLLESVQRPLFRCIRGVLQDDARSEDVLQEVFLTIVRKLRSLHDPRRFRPWALRIAMRRANRELRRGRTWTPLDAVPEPAESTESVGDRIASAENVERLLNRVSPTCRDVLVLHFVEGLTLAETAEVLGLPQGTVKSRLAAGLKTLRSSPHAVEPEKNP